MQQQIFKMSNLTLCYKKPYSVSWTCECDYESFTSANKRACELLEKDKNVITTIIPQKRWLPKTLKLLHIFEGNNF